MPRLVIIKIIPARSGIGWPRGWCSVRGDLGCLARHAGEAGYRSEALANQLGVSSRTLRREFQSAFGISLKGWLVQVRAVAIRLRLRGDETLDEIALSIGFSHSKELSREFRKVYGVSPSVYRHRERSRTHRPD